MAGFDFGGGPKNFPNLLRDPSVLERTLKVRVARLDPSPLPSMAVGLATLAAKPSLSEANWEEATQQLLHAQGLPRTEQISLVLTAAVALRARHGAKGRPFCRRMTELGIILLERLKEHPPMSEMEWDLARLAISSANVETPAAELKEIHALGCWLLIDPKAPPEYRASQARLSIQYLRGLTGPLASNDWPAIDAVENGLDLVNSDKALARELLSAGKTLAKGISHPLFERTVRGLEEALHAGEDVGEFGR